MVLLLLFSNRAPLLFRLSILAAEALLLLLLLMVVLLLLGLDLRRNAFRLGWKSLLLRPLLSVVSAESVAGVLE